MQRAKQALGMSLRKSREVVGIGGHHVVVNIKLPTTFLETMQRQILGTIAPRATREALKTRRFTAHTSIQLYPTEPKNVQPLLPARYFHSAYAA